MQSQSYDALTGELAKLGLVGYMQSDDQLVVSSQPGAAWPNRGNSFWLSLNEGVWYLSTWLPVGYRIPLDQDLAAVCTACMAGESAMYRVPSEIVHRFGLQELNNQDYQKLFSRD